MAFTLNDYLSREVTENALPGALKKLLLAVAETSKAISAEVASAPIAGELGLAGSENIQGEDQKKLDVISNEMMCRGMVPDISTYRSVLCPEGDDATWMIDRAG